MTLGLGVLFGLLFVFATVVAIVTFSVREDIRSQLLDVDSHVLNLLVRNEIAQVERDANLVFEFESIGEIELWGALLETASVDGVFAVQLFDVRGELAQSSSNSLIERRVPDEVMEKVSEGQVSSEFSPEVWLSDFIEVDFVSDRLVAVSDIYLPLRSADGALPLGTARYLMDGSALAKQFVVLDERLRRQALVAIGLGGLAIFVLFWLAWKRLSEANARVLRHATRLKRANAELAMLARTSAVGSVTAHLIHGIKNPLAGLRQVVRARSSGDASLDEEEWRGASEAAERMQRMVEEVVAVLQDTSSGLRYETESGDLLEALQDRFGRRAAERSIAFSVSGPRDLAMDSSISSIVSLVASNLVKNALEATPEGGRVRVELAGDGEEASLLVSDTGPGVPPELREQLFAPVSSGKSGGAGIGLAISLQLARHIGGSLRYVDTTSEGAVFELAFSLRERSLGDEG
ncbi:HAMP domain-containing sensor histidine kinase [Pelagicoccus sp. SDUM812005]|uniref:sensor histidine kinase n=1 Tax=Pelagicoccus sp. SDUM812005 TaxID=3041257 RepID=UPI00280D733C|nr:HAMP domain-containing sensor histidine kinase [Pelagicoccus sp. SDUM812005]MDQ8181860.1 HAMP domain-containing sensor histidine kinase [Pelagicoccus sp. SDUM812005]